MGIEYDPITWSRLVKERDFHQCLLCGSRDELQAKRVGEGYTLDSGVTLCAKCADAATCDDLEAVARDTGTTRLNLDMNRSLYLDFREACRVQGVSVSEAVRRLIIESMRRKGA